VLWRFRTHASEHAERRAARIAGGLLFALAAYVVFSAMMATCLKPCSAIQAATLT